MKRLNEGSEPRMAKKLKWGTIEYLDFLIDEYFEKVKANHEMPNITGLRLHIDMTDDCWKYYINDRWKVKRKTPEEIEEIEEKEAQKVEEQVFEELMEITDSGTISDGDDIGDYHIKERLSSTLKKAKDRIDDAIIQNAASAKNPAYFIFYQKSAMGYRETAPEAEGQKQLPSQINILVMPQPEKPREISVIEVKALDK
jgi:hypothetical protein